MARWIMLLLLCSSLLFAQDTISLAVMDFEGLGVSDDEAAIITGKIRTELIKKPLFKVMARSEMAMIVQEMEFQQSGICSDAACAVEMGKILGVERILAGSIGRIGSIYTISMKMIDIETSEIIYSVSNEFAGPIENLLTIHTTTIVNNLVDEIQRKQFARIIIKTTPDKASVAINNEPVGITPFTSAYLPGGDYRIDITKENYTSVSEQVTLIPGEAFSKQFTLNFTKEHVESLERDKEKSKKRRQNIRRIVFGSIALGAAGGALYFNSKASSSQETIDELYSEYKTADTGFDQYKSDIESEQDTFDSYAQTRNILFIVAGASAVGFAISIPF